MRRFCIRALVLAGLTTAAQAANPVFEAQAAAARRLQPVNRERVTADLKSAGLPASPAVWYAVPAMSDTMRLAWSYPEDGRLNVDLNIVAAQDEFEPASFQLYSFADKRNVTLTPTLFKGEGGATMPAAALDIKVVKLWFQNGNGWLSYFADVGLKLIPELLLHDENMIRVDMEGVANYARLKDASGERHVWISAPRELHEATSFRPVADPFEDAKTLQPVTLKGGEFKQFFATLHVPAGQKPGIYKGAITVAEGGKRLFDIPVAIRVLPFTLPNARPYFDLDREMILSFMGGLSLSRIADLHNCDHATALRKYDEYLANLRNHGITHPSGVDQTEESLNIIRRHGFTTKPLIEAKSFAPWYGLNFGGRMSFDQMMTARDGARQCAEFYQRVLGHTDLLCGYGDEQGTAFVATHRNFYKYYHDYGIRIGCAGHEALLYKGGYTYGYYPMGGEPDAHERIRPWNEIGDRYVGFYASQHTGPENPQFFRRQHGLLGYFSNLSLVYNYEFDLLNWNDLATHTYKPMVVAMYNCGGIVDTLQWEGFREGVDDMRYATQLKLLARDAVASGDTGRKLTANKALQYLALLNRTEMDLEVVRAEMIEHILKLLALQ
ncbi:MAG: DUF4402 domain-containing protein [Kiritimatiellia bacterium]|jgi:hypothetical protein